MKTNSFTNRPDDERMYIRRLIETLRGDTRGYTGDGFTVAMPNDHPNRNAMFQALRNEGWILGHQGEVFFPLGSDKPADHLRHIYYEYQRKGDAPGYWRFAHFEPMEKTA